MLEPTSPGSPIKCWVPLQAISIFLLSDTVSGSNPCSCARSIFLFFFCCWNSLLSSVSSCTHFIPESWDNCLLASAFHHLHAYRRGQLFFYLSYNQLVICCFLLQGTGCCSLTPAPFHFSWCLCTSFEYFSLKGHLYLSAFQFRILLCSPWSPAAVETWVNTDLCDEASPKCLHLQFKSRVSREFPQKSGQPFGPQKALFNKLNRSNMLTVSFYLRKVMQPSNVKIHSGWGLGLKMLKCW